MSPRRHDDEGIAMISVLAIGLILAMLVAALLQYGIGSQRQARFDQDWRAALAAADAGIDDFLFRVNRDTNYWEQADDCAECAPTLDPDNPALTGFTALPSGDGAYSYDVDASVVAAEGTIEVTSTGRVNEVERSVTVLLRLRSFLDYLYFTEFETLDPVAYPIADAQTWAGINCSRHRYDDPSRHAECSEIIWVSGDRVDGPFHSNDQIAVHGDPVWTEPASTSDPDAQYYDWASGQSCDEPGSPAGCTSDPDFSEWLVFDDALKLPPSNNDIKVEADPAVGGEGCMYVGATFIRFAADGSATVRAEASDDPDATKCPTDGTMGSLPDNGVIYVRAAGAGEPCLAEPPHPYDLGDDITEYDQCAGDVFVEGTLDGRLTVAAENSIIVTEDLEYEDGTRRDGDDLLGLVANNFVEIMHPVEGTGDFYWDYIGRIVPGGPITADDCDATSGDGEHCWVVAEETRDIGYLPGGQRFTAPDVHAAILSAAHSFRVQNHDEGDHFDQPIEVFGAIAQLYRGPVGTFDSSGPVTGYLKDYEYDERLRFISPPHFLDPVKSAWTVRAWSEDE